MIRTARAAIPYCRRFSDVLSLEQKTLISPPILQGENSLDPQLTESFLNSTLLIHGSKGFAKHIVKSTYELSQTPIGIELLGRIQRQSRFIPVIETDKKNGQAITNRNGYPCSIELNPNWCATICSSKEDGTLFPTKLPFSLVFAHELIHSLHRLEEGRLHTTSLNEEFPGFPNTEELYTIMGRKTEKYLSIYPDRGPLESPISEHAFCDAFHLPKREVYQIFLPTQIDEEYSEGGYTRLHLAAAKGQVEILQNLIRKGANINRKSRIGHKTALMFAAQYGKTEAARTLLYAGADPGIFDIYTRTAKDLLPKNTHSELFRLLSP